jgi:hypothetical protein
MIVMVRKDSTSPLGSIFVTEGFNSINPVPRTGV